MSGKIFIGGVWRDGDGETFASLDPATQTMIWEGRAASNADVNTAVSAARVAFESWRRVPVEERIAHVQRFKALLEQRAADFTTLIAEETGKMRWDAKGEVQAMVNKADISIRAYHERTGTVCSEQKAMRSVLRHRPHGVMAVFGPYNFPGHLPNGHIMPALIAGNTIVFKPSDHTPKVAERTVALWETAGLPAGVLNLVQGGRETGMALAAHDSIDGLLFTGSAEVGALLHRQFAGRPDKMLALEMGGNNPLIAHGVRNLEHAALMIVQSAFLSSGQRCTCARRLVVPQGAAGDALIEALVILSGTIRVGAYTDTPEPYMGPLIANAEAEKLLTAYATLERAGGRVLVPLRRLKEGLPFLTPGIIDVTEVSDRPDREYFGPLLQVIRVADFDAAVAEANHTRLGLAAGLISDDAALYKCFAADIRAGVVNWNRPTNGASSALPFGGIGASGNHRPSAYYAADYCAYPVASQESDQILPPESLLPGIGS